MRIASPAARLVVAALALAMTALDAAKPLHIDDTYMLRVAEQIRVDPLDPFGFDGFWLQWPKPVYESLAPPVLAYWWSPALALFGDSPVLWKLWLLPFALLFCFTVYSLLRRFAPGLELPLTAVTALSPAFLPSLNLMPDIPAFGLAMAGLLLYLRAAEGRRWDLALAAGVVLGVAMQTKYTMVATLGATLVHGALHRRLPWALASAALAVGLFWGWEGFLLGRYGYSMFAGQLGSELYRDARSDLVAPFARHLGAALCVPALFGAAALGWSRRRLAILAALLLAGHACLLRFAIADELFMALGCGSLLLLGYAALRLAFRCRTTSRRWRQRIRWNRTDWLLVLWLGGEIIVAFTTAPFPAMRRVMGITLVGTLVLGRFSLLARRRDVSTLPAWGLVGLGAVLGLVYALTDLREAAGQRDAVEAALAIIGEPEPGSTVWFTGHWGFQFHAERRGMRALVPDHSAVRRGDWLVVPAGDRVDRQEIRIPASDFEKVERWSVSNAPPLTTGFAFYAGAAPLRHLEGPRMSVDLFRARRDATARTAWPFDALVDFVRLATPGASEWAVAALSRGLVHRDPERRRRSAETLGGMGARAHGAVESLTRMHSDPNPEVRAAARRALDLIEADLRRAAP